MLWKGFVLVFMLCFACGFLFAVLFLYWKMHNSRKYSFKVGVYDGKNSVEDVKIRQYLKDNMEHHSSKAFKSIEDPDER